MFFRKMMKLFN